MRSKNKKSGLKMDQAHQEPTRDFRWCSKPLLSCHRVSVLVHVNYYVAPICFNCVLFLLRWHVNLYHVTLTRTRQWLN